MVERFNRNLKLVINAAYSEARDPEDAVEKYVAAYRNMPHSDTGKMPNLLMFNSELNTKLHQIPSTPQGGQEEGQRGQGILYAPYQAAGRQVR